MAGVTSPENRGWRARKVPALSDTPVHRVLVVDDHTVLADLMANAIDGEDDVECVGVADDLATAAELAAALDPDTVLVRAAAESIGGTLTIESDTTGTTAVIRAPRAPRSPDS